MRVAIVTESFLPTLNGVTTSVCRVASALRTLGHDVVIIAPAATAAGTPDHPEPTAPGRTPTSYEGVPVRTLPSVSVRQFPAGVPTTALRKALQDFAPDVVHVASPFLVGARALQLAHASGIPAVAIYQTDMPGYIAQHGPARLANGAARAAWRWIRRIHDYADRTLAPSRATLDTLADHGVPRVALWARGVDTSLFHAGHRDDPQTQALRRELAPDGEVLVGYVGRLAPEKELWRLAEVTGLPGARLVLVGDGPSREQVGAELTAAVATSSGRPSRSPVFLGRREGTDLARAYAAFDVFVHAGTRETFGQTLQEAAATRLPVVAPAVGGPLDLVDHGRSGLLFDPREPGSLAACVTTLVEGPTLRELYGAAGHAAVAGRSWEALTTDLLDHYAAAVGHRRVLRRAS